MAQGTPSASADITIGAEPETVYRLITDLDTLADLAAETTSMRWQKGDSARPGAVFKGSNRNGSKSWTTTCTVTDAEPDKSFAFEVRSLIIPIAHWRYDIEGTDDGCRVIESTWDNRPGWFTRIAGFATGVPDRQAANTEHIKTTLQRLKNRAEENR